MAKRHHRRGAQRRPKPVRPAQQGKALAEAIGVPPSAVSQRTQTVRNALGLEERTFDAALSHSTKRRWYLEQYERVVNWPAGVGIEDDSVV
jgi:hypothetical protein